jgi:hypothetical protein
MKMSMYSVHSEHRVECACAKLPEPSAFPHGSAPGTSNMHLLSGVLIVDGAL